MNIYYDGAFRECVDVQELYDQMSAKTITGMSFTDWFKYMIDSGFEPNKDYVKQENGNSYFVPVDVAKQFCRITAFKIASEHNCFSEIFITYLLQDVIDAEVNRLKVHETEDYVNKWKNIMNL